jgi:hypothetical protein
VFLHPNHPLIGMIHSFNLSASHGIAIDINTLRCPPVHPASIN